VLHSLSAKDGADASELTICSPVSICTARCLIAARHSNAPGITAGRLRAVQSDIEPGVLSPKLEIALQYQLSRSVISTDGRPSADIELHRTIELHQRPSKADIEGPSGGRIRPPGTPLLWAQVQSQDIAGFVKKILHQPNLGADRWRVYACKVGPASPCSQSAGRRAPGSTAPTMPSISLARHCLGR
jgi:hypothetical protein